jgi:hypothetical protein
MNGPDHYKAAEDHLQEAFNHHWGSAEERYNLAAAQVHATLALTAATFEQKAGEHLSVAWREAVK